MKIGDFSKLTGLSVRTLRYWSDLGLLTPARRSDADVFASDYREFTAVQLGEINRVLALRDAGFTLAEIGRMNAKAPSRAELRRLLETKLADASRERLSIDHRIAAIRARLRHLDFEEDYNMADVTVKNLPPILVASIRAKGLGDDDWEACAQIEREYTPTDPLVKVRYLPAEQVACIIHNGGWGAAMRPTIDDFFEWVQLNGAKLRQPYREIFHIGEREGKPWDEFVTEMQYPLA